MIDSHQFDTEFINNLLYIKKDYSKISCLLKDRTDIRSYVILGKIELYSGNIDEAENFFTKAGYKTGIAYCKFLKGEFAEGYKILSDIKEQSSFCHWLICIIEIFLNKKENIPTYFQIRNYYEQDIEMLFLYKRDKEIGNILNFSQYISNFNMEIFKYNGRIMLNHGFNEIAERFLKKSLDVCYNDPETHYLLGELYIKTNRIQLAKESFNKCIKVNNGYYPAEIKLKTIK